VSEGKEYRVKTGDCVSSIAHRNGLFWETIWNHPENQSLKSERVTHTKLYPGDEIFVPTIVLRDESCSTDAKHRFRRKGVPVIFRVQIMRNGIPIADEDFEFEIDGQEFEGTTDSDGYVEQKIPPNAQRGRILIPNQDIEAEFRLGYLDPVSTVAGVQARLANLGYDCGKVDDDYGERTRNAIAAFQHRHKLDGSGDINEETRSKLVEMHGN
jgi:hypothetical protein